jgi:hypothetical protein
MPEVRLYLAGGETARRNHRKPAVTERILKTFTRPDGRRRVVILRRADGCFGFREDRRFTTPSGSKWGPLIRYSTICDSAETAEREARAAVDWLNRVRPESP